MRKTVIGSNECDHDWTAWNIIGHTGDWFNPHIVERHCKKCKKSEEDEQ